MVNILIHLKVISIKPLFLIFCVYFFSGMLKIESEDYVSLEAHLLAKSSEKVWECSRSLQNMIHVAELSRLEAEPKCFRVSRPTEENIGLYFFPQGMR
jgi:hypothetical protein